MFDLAVDMAPHLREPWLLDHVVDPDIRAVLRKLLAADQERCVLDIPLLDLVAAIESADRIARRSSRG